ncbi:MAG: Cys-Gln thioester bond-forming surface protein, partial [Clostridiales Family XIII bacterium]|nr:Cys-Gln thioester bond-forming surface protein [Clostridiales Family XIII bacterium]
MNVLLLKGRTRPIAFILAALLTFGLLSCFGVGAVPAFAVPGEFAMYESTWWVTNSRVDLFTGNRFYSVYTGSVAYCMDHGLASPTGHYYDSYEPSAEDRARMTAAMYYGYPSTTVVGGIPLSEDQARCATQLAIWALRGCLDIWDLKAMPGTPDYPNDGNAVIAAARILYDQTQGGFASPQADIALPASKGGTPYGTDAVRYGPFRANKASKATAALSGAPAGAWFGSASGSRLDANNLPADADFYLYIPAAAQTQGNIRVDVAAEYSVFEVGFYTAYRSAQDVTMYVAPYSAKKEANCTLLPFGKARIDKRDSVTGGALAGAAFKVQQWNGSAFADTNISIAWNASLHRYETGFLCATETNGGRFRLVETANPYSYSGSFSQELKVAGYGNTSAYTAANTPARLRVELEKTDAGTGENAPQGDASLENAEYGIYMAENRTHPDGTVFKKDQLVKTGHTDAGGQIVFKDLFPAKYYVKEIAPSEGYLLDETAYPVDGTAGSPAKPITLSVSVNEQVVKQAFHFRKVGPVCGTDEPVPLAAGFTIYLIRDLSGVKDGTWTPADDGDGDGGDAAADGGAGDGPATTEGGGEKTSGGEAAENEAGGNGSAGAGGGEETAEN